jgi:DHA1 family multidrug resistance protein-like MFS transporter
MLGKKRCRLRFEPWQRTLYTIVVAQIVAMLGFTISVPFLPFYIQELGVTDFDQVAFWVGLINSAAPISMALTAPIWGLLSDRFGRKPMLIRSMFGAALMLGLMATARTVPQVAILRVIQGSLSGTVAAATTLVASSMPRERTGYGLGLLQTAIFAANSLGPLAGGVVGGTIGYRAAFIGSGVLLFAAGLLVLFFVHENFTPAPRKRDGNALVLTGRTIADRPVLLVMLILLMMNSLSLQVTNPVLPLFVQTMVPSAQAASTATGMIIGATALSNALSAVSVGRWADRLGRRRVLLTCLTVGSLVYFPQMLTRHPAQLLVLRFILGLAMGGVIPSANAVIAEWAPEGRQGGIYGISASLNALGRAVGPVIGTFVVTSLGIARVFPVTGTLLGLVAIMVALTTRLLDQSRPAAAAHPQAASEARPDMPA